MNDDPEIERQRNNVKLERLELALRASNEGIWDWHTAEAAIFYSRRILEFLECGKDNAPNLFLPPYDHIHADEREAFERAVTLALRQGGPETLAVDARVLTGGGDWRWLRIRGTVVRDREGNAVRIAGSMINISLRKAAEAQVEEERFLLRQLIDHVPLQIYFKDLESRFTMANQRMREWLGISGGDDLTGKHDRDFFETDHWKPAEADEQRIIQTGEAMIDQLEHETWHEGDETWVITSKFPWKDRQGQIKGTFGVSSDVTKLVKAERAATELASLLQQKNEAYEEELLLAREIQQALAGEGFPTATATDKTHVSFGARYIPISGLAGDFFEVMKMNDHSYGVLICDVMGHGVRSALIVAMLRGLLEKQRAQAQEPGLFLQGLNDGLAAILERAGTTMFATAFFGVIDLSAQTFRYACAGHPGPIVAGKEGVRQIACERSQKGPGLGLLKNATYPTNSLDLSEIDRMVLFTDGVLEAENQSGEPFFENRLMEIIGKKSDEPMGNLLDGILSAVLAFSEGQHFDDDVCLLGIQITRDGVTQS
ncbi:MAG: PAS domain S-box protein [Verrucomicrobiaceae bacterium]|nr:MAG: PAS domain S-box protein [Verrucomicrobiaceae bacterium]